MEKETECSLKESPIILHYHKSELFVVPSVHYHHIFAKAVHKICDDKETQPEAIAVELGPKTTKSAEKALTELGVSPKNNKKLPIMIGLTRPNQMIHVAFKQKAVSLQKKTGKDLSEIDPDILKSELGYSGYDVLCFSPTDSIIEAMRCAIEKEFPLYGIDLDDMAVGFHKSIQIEDPTVRLADLNKYITRNAPCAAKQRDREIDARREIVMAARLKTLLGMYQKVLFICGLGHWVKIKKLMENPKIQPAFFPESHEENPDVKKAVIHPLVAVKCMGLMPLMGEAYERARNWDHKNSRTGKHAFKLDPYLILNQALKKTYKKHFRIKGPAGLNSKKSNDFFSIAGFEEYLKNLTLINLRKIPDIFLIIQSARGFMSREFVNTAAKELMDIDWATPDKFPDYSLVMPSQYSKSKSFIYRIIPDGSLLSDEVKIPYEWKTKEGKYVLESHQSYVHTWIPWENLISGLSLDAINKAIHNNREIKTEVYQGGSLMEGIDVKATLRSFSEGKEKIYIKNSIRKKQQTASLNRDGFPVAWILNPKNESKGNWAVLFEPFSTMEKYISDHSRFNYIKKEEGHKMVSFIGYGDTHKRDHVTALDPRIRLDLYRGLLLFHPICWTRQQFAQWFEVEGYKRSPICRANGLHSLFGSDLKDKYYQRHDIRINEYNWSTALILMAIPFADRTVTVVAPDDYTFEPVVLKKAKKFGVDLWRCSLNEFSKDRKKRMSINYMLPILRLDPKCVYPKNYEKAIGEKLSDYEELVPLQWKNFSASNYV
jgi:hypothetical protein